MKDDSNIIDIRGVELRKKYGSEGLEEKHRLEQTLYEILDLESRSWMEAAEIAAEALGEDLDIYLEDELDDDDVDELDFEGDETAPWEDIDAFNK